MNNVSQAAISAGRRVDPLVSIALAGIFLGWFVLDTLEIRIGPVRHPLKFYEMLAAIIDPPRVLLGLDSGHVFSSTAFGLVCATLLLACHVGSLPPRRLRPMLVCAPLGLMLMIALLLYIRTPGDLFADPGRGTPVLSDLVRLANDVFSRGAAAITRASAGAGLWVSGAACALLAWKGNRERSWNWSR
ncbi:MAG: hypothetical protein JSS24_06530 [Proteobacteria bacterium]|nr:hypothetical protein [Pseudomonadota bacterium]